MSIFEYDKELEEKKLREAEFELVVRLDMKLDWQKAKIRQLLKQQSVCLL